MIVVDTSALLAILFEEEEGPYCAQALKNEAKVLMSAGTLAEALIVAGRRGVDTQMNALLAQLELEIVKVSAVDAREMAEGYSRWGKGVHPARLNLGDCFAYALAKERNLPLLFVGNDFAQTDVKPALPPRPSPANPRAI